MAAPKFL